MLPRTGTSVSGAYHTRTGGPGRQLKVSIRDFWARNTSPNKDVKIYIGAPASSTAAGTGYQTIDTLTNIAVTMRKSFPSFGGVMMWDASQAFGKSPCRIFAGLLNAMHSHLANSRYDLAVKNALSAAGGTGFTFPACSAPAFMSGTNYQGGSKVSFGGYVGRAICQINYSDHSFSTAAISGRLGRYISGCE